MGKSVQIFLVFLLQHLRRELNGGSDDTPRVSASALHPARGPQTNVQQTLNLFSDTTLLAPFPKQSSETTQSPKSSFLLPLPNEFIDASQRPLPRAPLTIVDHLFGCMSVTTSTCVAHHHSVTTSPVSRFIIDLLSPSEMPTDATKRTSQVGSGTDLGFASVLKASIERQFVCGGYCRECGRSARILHQEKVRRGFD